MRRISVMMTLAIIGVAALTGAPALAQSADATALTALLPATPTGRSAADGEKVESQAAGIEVTQVSRTYTDAAGTTVELSFIDSPAMVMASQGMAMMFTNPAMLQQMNANSPDKQFGTIGQDGWTGWTVVDGEKGESEVIGFTDTLLVRIDISRADAKILGTFVDLVPWKKLAALYE